MKRCWNWIAVINILLPSVVFQVHEVEATNGDTSDDLVLRQVVHPKGFPLEESNLRGRPLFFTLPHQVQNGEVSNILRRKGHVPEDQSDNNDASMAAGNSLVNYLESRNQNGSGPDSKTPSSHSASDITGLYPFRRLTNNKFAGENVSPLLQAIQPSPYKDYTTSDTSSHAYNQRVGPYYPGNMFSAHRNIPRGGYSNHYDRSRNPKDYYIPNNFGHKRNQQLHGGRIISPNYPTNQATALLARGALRPMQASRRSDFQKSLVNNSSPMRVLEGGLAAALTALVINVGAAFVSSHTGLHLRRRRDADIQLIDRPNWFSTEE